MASGINTTFRQVSTPLEVAVFGSLFATNIRSTVIDSALKHLGRQATRAASAGHAIGAGGLGAASSTGCPVRGEAVIRQDCTGFVNASWIR
jgi:hypothetical protein